MVDFRITSVADPFTDDATFGKAFRLFTGAAALGYQTRSRVVLDPEAVTELLDAMRERGVARSIVPPTAGADWETVFDRALDALWSSPQPEREWESMRALLGDDLLAQLVGISDASLRRYSGGSRPTPDIVAARLHTLVRITSALLGSYNDYGVRRWFVRPRTQLGGRAPQEVMSGGWSPDDEDVQLTVALAEALLGAGGAA